MIPLCPLVSPLFQLMYQAASAKSPLCFNIFPILAAGLVFFIVLTVSVTPTSMQYVHRFSIIIYIYTYIMCIYKIL